MVPHGLSVIVTAPAVFRWTCPADPERHLKAAEYLGTSADNHFVMQSSNLSYTLHIGANVTNKKASDAGLILADTIITLLDRWRSFVPDGLHEMGYNSDHLEMLVKGALPQKKVRLDKTIILRMDLDILVQ